MHGAGNDFVLIDARSQPFELSPERAAGLADRNRGIGCDQILVLREANDSAHLLRYEIHNADGSEAAQCGNGARCVALFIELNGEAAGQHFTVESPAGVIAMERCGDGEYRLDMGIPEFAPARIPTTLQPDHGRYRLDSPWGELDFGAVSMGNPHALISDAGFDPMDIPAAGSWLSTHAAFPEGVNVGFARVRDRSAIDLRVVERGTGETLACGSGACAAVAILRRSGRVNSKVEVFLPGGRLVIEWPEADQALLMKGPAKHVFRGIMNE